MPDRNIILCGFMGCGKTTVGGKLARLLCADFIDMDEYLESREAMTVPEIFRVFGESGFRDREHSAVIELSKMRGIVLATGGGALTFERNAIPLAGSGAIVFLNVNFDECYRRISKTDRPLVRSNTRDELEQIHRKRNEIYLAAASVEINAEGAPDEVASAVAAALGYAD